MSNAIIQHNSNISGEMEMLSGQGLSSRSQEPVVSASNQGSIHLRETQPRQSFMQRITPVKNWKGKLAYGTVSTVGLAAGITAIGIGMTAAGGAALSAAAGVVASIKTHFKSCNSQLLDAEAFLKNVNICSVTQNNNPNYLLRLSDSSPGRAIAMKPWGRFWPASLGGHVSNEDLLSKINKELTTLLHEKKPENNSESDSVPESIRKLAVDAAMNIVQQQLSKSLMTKCAVTLVAFTATGATIGTLVPGAGSLAGGIVGFGVGILNMFTAYNKMKYDINGLRKQLNEQLQQPDFQQDITSRAELSYSPVADYLNAQFDSPPSSPENLPPINHADFENFSGVHTSSSEDSSQILQYYFTDQRLSDSVGAEDNITIGSKSLVIGNQTKEGENQLPVDIEFASSSSHTEDFKKQQIKSIQLPEYVPPLDLAKEFPYLTRIKL